MNIENKAVNTLRMLSVDQIENANSGHPGLPLGAAPMAYALFKNHLVRDSKDLDWKNRDRFVLSAGHGSALLYSLFYLFDYGLSLDDLKNFRQLDSRTPGHPEYGHTLGVLKQLLDLLAKGLLWQLVWQLRKKNLLPFITRKI